MNGAVIMATIPSISAFRVVLLPRMVVSCLVCWYGTILLDFQLDLRAAEISPSFAMSTQIQYPISLELILLMILLAFHFLNNIPTRPLKGEPSSKVESRTPWELFLTAKNQNQTALLAACFITVGIVC